MVLEGCGGLVSWVIGLVPKVLWDVGMVPKGFKDGPVGYRNGPMG